MRPLLDAAGNAATRTRRRIQEYGSSGPPAPTAATRARRRATTTGAADADAPPAALSAPPSVDYDSLPALFVAEDAFSLPTYWDRRYRDHPETQPEEWYRTEKCESASAVIAAHLDPRLAVLQLGVGTSRLQEAMARGFRDDGADGDERAEAAGEGCFSSVLSVDFSDVAVARQKARHAALLADSQTRAWASRLTYARADVRAMPHLADASFGGGVLDKGALDALLCGDDGDDAAARCLAEVSRVLPPGAAYVMVTSAAPDARRRLLPTAAAADSERPSPAPSPPPPPPPLLLAVLKTRLR